jgi:hypothetical protein
VRLNGLSISRDRLRVAYARLDLDSTDPASLTGGFGYSAAEPRWRLAGSIQARQGLDILDASDGCGAAPFSRCTAVGAVPISRLEGDPTATVLRAEAFSEYRPIPNITFALGVRAQVSSDPLLSFEEFSAGNYTVGRGLRSGLAARRRWCRAAVRGPLRLDPADLSRSPVAPALSVLRRCQGHQRGSADVRCEQRPLLCRRRPARIVSGRKPGRRLCRAAGARRITDRAAGSTAADHLHHPPVAVELLT